MNAPDPAKSLVCIACRMCCDGTMFARVSLLADEKDPPARFRFPLTGRGAERCFAQPCTQLGSQGCQAYVERPIGCRTFSCASLKEWEAGGIDRSELERRIAVAKQAISHLQPFLHHGEDLQAARRRCVALATASQRTAEETRFVLLFAALDRLLDRHFREDGQRLFRSDNAPTAIQPSD